MALTASLAIFTTFVPSSCHLRGKERQLRATFVARNASSRYYRRGVATILSVVRPGRKDVCDLARRFKTKSVPAFTGYDLNSLMRLEFENGYPSRSAK